MVQISASIFAESAHRMKRWLPHVDFQSYIVAGAGTGIAAAFNAPLGGIASPSRKSRPPPSASSVISSFSRSSSRGSRRTPWEETSCISAIPSSALTKSASSPGPCSSGSSAESSEGCFGKIVSSERLRGLGGSWWQRALVFGFLVALIGYFFKGQTAFQLPRHACLVHRQSDRASAFFPVGKLLATAFSTLSGLGGGILAPSLSVGAWLGVTTAKLAALPNLKACALLGMVATSREHSRSRSPP